MATGTIRYWAAAKAAAGLAEEGYDAATLGEALDDAAKAHGPVLEQVLARCSFLVDGVRADRTVALTDGLVVEVLPPFAGGALVPR
ncbi:MAG TPA: MoaD/ThiS family protein [Actinomycetes bacterium]|nr:MoaD/ThiS family protein [Actinomycetes bacterium]